MGMNDVRYLACPECGTWTTRTAEWLAEHPVVACYQCGTSIEAGSLAVQCQPEPVLRTGGSHGIR
jgi:uncharacterized Zn finger protein